MSAETNPESIPNEAQLTAKDQEKRRSKMEQDRKRMRNSLYFNLLSELFLVETMLVGKPAKEKMQLKVDLEKMWKSYGRRISQARSSSRLPYFGKMGLSSRP